MSDIRSNILWDDTLSDDQRMVYVFEKLHGFFVRHPDWLEECADKSVYNGLTLQRFLNAGKLVNNALNLLK